MLDFLTPDLLAAFLQVILVILFVAFEMMWRGSAELWPHVLAATGSPSP